MSNALVPMKSTGFYGGMANWPDRLLILLDPGKMLSQTEKQFIVEC